MHYGLYNHLLIRYFRSRDCCAAQASQASSKIPAADALLSPCAEHYGFQLPDNPHDTALLPPAALARHLGGDAAAALPLAQAALHCCGVPTWHLLQVCCRFRVPLTVPDEQFLHGPQLSCRQHDQRYACGRTYGARGIIARQT